MLCQPGAVVTPAGVTSYICDPILTVQFTNFLFLMRHHWTALMRPDRHQAWENY